MKGNKVSIVIPTYNRDYCLSRAINSVLRQTYEKFELWIIDDGSIDNTRHLVAAFNDKRINYFKIKNSGVAQARNIGIEKSSGDLLAFLDSDDEWLPTKLEKQLAYLNDNPDIEIVYSGETWIRNNKKINLKKIHEKHEGYIFEKCLPICFIGPSTVVIKKDVFNKVGYFNKDYVVCEDYDLWLRITSLYKVGIVDEPLVNKYGGHSDQLSTKFRGMDYWRVRSLDSIFNLSLLTIEQKKLISKEIVKKSKILKQGYIKHNNTKHLDFVENLLVKHEYR